MQFFLSWGRRRTFERIGWTKERKKKRTFEWILEIGVDI
jgi:hypothetical protein